MTLSERDNDIKRIREAILSEGQKLISFDEARDFWTWYSNSIFSDWIEVPTEAVILYRMIENYFIYWTLKREI